VTAAAVVPVTAAAVVPVPASVAVVGPDEASVEAESVDLEVYSLRVPPSLQSCRTMDACLA
jgi:hypothetical protein